MAQTNILLETGTNELEIVEFYHFMHFGKALVMVQDETADSLIFIAFGQVE